MTKADLDEQLRIVRFGVHAQDRADAMTAIRNAFAQLKSQTLAAEQHETMRKLVYLLEKLDAGAMPLVAT